MGIKSTRYLTRESAISRIEDLRFKLFGGYDYSYASDTDLEDLLEDLNDQYSSREYGGDSGFDNYIIADQETVDKENSW